MTIGGAIRLLLYSPKSFLESVMRIPIIAKMIPDRAFISIVYRLRHKHRINLNNPQSFNEKLLWLSLYDRRPVYTRMVDKYEAKIWMIKRLKSEEKDISCIIPTYGIYNHYDEINFDKLPESFVMKTTHDSGGVAVVYDKTHLDHASAKKKLEKSLTRNYFWYTREWPYKDVKPRIIIEKKLETIEKSPIDYKNYCFNGVAKYLYLVQDRDVGETVDYYDMNWNHLPIKQVYPNNSKRPQKPECWSELVECAEFLSKGIPFLRVDFYVDKDGHYYIGELTFTPSSGLSPLTPAEWDYKFGELLVLPEKQNSIV